MYHTSVLILVKPFKTTVAADPPLPYRYEWCKLEPHPDMPQSAETETRERVMAAARRLFAEKGVDAATLRDITDAAHANLAAVNYYFRSKEELIRSVFEADLKPIAEARLRALDVCEATAGKGGPTLEKVVEAFVRPMVELSTESSGDRSIVRLLLQARALPRPLTNSIVAEQLDPVHQRFITALGRSLPSLSKAEVGLRYDFARGAVMQILGDLDPAARRLPSLLNSQSDIDNDAVISYLTSFIAAGFRANPTAFRAKPRKASTKARVR